MARWLIEQGSRHLVLVGRSGASDAAKKTLSELEATGAQIVIEQADVAHEDRITQIFKKIDETMPPLRGIIHSAGAIDDGVLLQQDWARFDKVMTAKIYGTWNLHMLTQNKALDFFVLFSSGASLIGSAGQGNHAAANAFMDALAHYRRGLGLPAVSINWGAWSEIGTVVRHSQSDRFTMHGKSTIAPQQGLLILEHLLSRQVGTPPQVGVLPVKWLEVFEQFGERKQPTFFSELIKEVRLPEKGRQETALQKKFLEHLQKAPVSQRLGLLHKHVSELARKVLGIDSSRPISSQQPLSELGLDSLMAVELRNALGVIIEKTLPATLLYDYPTIDELVGCLAKDLELSNGVDDEPHRENGKSIKAQQEVKLDALSEDEMAALLEEKLGAV
jgi:acyl carrier protein/NADP-dependent 3-hydroxy acid dehydrogenase YdfG